MTMLARVPADGVVHGESVHMWLLHTSVVDGVENPEAGGNGKLHALLYC